VVKKKKIEKNLIRASLILHLRYAYIHLAFTRAVIPIIDFSTVSQSHSVSCSVFDQGWDEKITTVIKLILGKRKGTRMKKKLKSLKMRKRQFTSCNRGACINIIT